MPRWAKVVLVVVVVLFTAVAAAAVLAARWVKSQVRDVAAVADEAMTFARGRDAEACVAESLNRVRRCSVMGAVCQGKAKAFMRTCLRSAAVAPAICASVPKPSEFMAAGQWQVEECTRRGWATDQRCIGIIGEIPLYCAEQR